MPFSRRLPEDGERRVPTFGVIGKGWNELLPVVLGRLDVERELRELMELRPAWAPLVVRETTELTELVESESILREIIEDCVEAELVLRAL
ncbi:MAG: hypothetical protein PW789_19950 [Edaphobacter sp.]|uniref:hypothetical protein n=1 Tax=Edaphobacter sp. TaxID=1934404 RepID=UPI00239B6C5A|nr:hypothetical protein [Edaphobacter sp.]MDE1178855.1 hypothetical protein [Edaphobacter sp.]